MDPAIVLSSHVAALVDGLGTDDDALADALTALVGHLDSAVSSYLGLRLSLVLDGFPITLTAFALGGRRPVASLRLALPSLGPGFGPASQIMFYAGTPGTFVDLAADLAHLDERPSVALDVELPPPTVVPGFTGLAEYATVNRAVGVLIARGEDPDQAGATLRRRAGAAGLDVPAYSARLLGE